MEDASLLHWAVAAANAEDSEQDCGEQEEDEPLQTLPALKYTGDHILAHLSTGSATNRVRVQHLLLLLLFPEVEQKS
eukprot:1197789-Amphidinium_carterae.1